MKSYPYFLFCLSLDFYSWKSKFEEETSSFYKVLRGNYTNEKGEKVYRYICHRSGEFKTESNGKRMLKSQKSSKIGFYCTAFITAIDTGEKIIATFGKEHYGHNVDVEHLRISQEDREWIAGNFIKFKFILHSCYPQDVTLRFLKEKEYKVHHCLSPPPTGYFCVKK